MFDHHTILLPYSKRLFIAVVLSCMAFMHVYAPSAYSQESPPPGSSSSTEPQKPDLTDSASPPQSTVDQLNECNPGFHGAVGFSTTSTFLAGLPQDLAAQILSLNSEAYIVSYVHEDSAADQAGLEPTDVIVAILDDDYKLYRLSQGLGCITPSSSFKVFAYNLSSSKSKTLTLKPYASIQDINKKIAVLEVSALALPTDILLMLNYPPIPGILISLVESGSEAEKGGLQNGDYIVKMNGSHVVQFSDLLYAISKGSPGDVLKLTIFRHGEEEFIEILVALDDLGLR